MTSLGRRDIGGETQGLDVTARIVGRAEFWIASGLVAAQLGAAVWLTPRASQAAIAIPGFIAGFACAMAVIDLVLAILLFSNGAIDAQAKPVRLGAAYLFAALMVSGQLTAFPDALVPGQIIGASGSAVWIWTFWHVGFPLLIARYAIGRDDERLALPLWRTVGQICLLVGLLVTVATAGLPYLPALITGQSYFAAGPSQRLPLFVLAMNIMALLLVVRGGLRDAVRLWLAVAMVAACVDVWLTYSGGARFTLGWYGGRVATLVTSIAVLILVFRGITELYRQTACANEHLARMAHLDGLTGLANRRFLDATLATEWRRAQREMRPISFILVDVDFFKRFNDRYGHLQGDECLRIVADRMRSVARRPGDMAARYGGEEFALVLPATDAEGAARLAEELRAAIRAQGIPHLDSPGGFVTVSVGVASERPASASGQGFSVMVSRADTALYAAKEAGRNRVRTHVSDTAQLPELVA